MVRPGPIDWARSVLVYEEPVAPLIRNFKYRGDNSSLKALIEIARPLAETVMDCAPAEIHSEAEKTCVVPVPLHPRRLRKRMFNQALVMARALFPGLIVKHGMVRRTVHNSPQRGLSRKERRQNVRGIFEAGSIEDFSHFIIFDDVLTTGSTVREMARMLKGKGARKVLALTLARTLRDVC